MTTTTRLAFAVAVLAALSAAAEDTGPRVGYIYPAGGQAGSHFQAILGGQNLTSVTGAYLTGGADMKAEVMWQIRNLKTLKKEERAEIAKRLVEAWKDKIPEWAKDNPQTVAAFQSLMGKAEKEAASATGAETRLPTHALLDRIGELTQREWEKLAYELLLPREKKQQNAQIADIVMLDMDIEPNATPGDRELRLETPNGLTNPLCFQIGALQEVCELEPNEPRTSAKTEPSAPVRLPAVLNGQILPGDVDRFRVEVQKGQRLVFQTQARHLTPYLADAVPGWFQAVVSLHDDKGAEVASADDYRFDPDPVLFFEPKEDGVYELEIRDALYRGREDFVYRISAGELPFITSTAPLGGKEEKPVTVSVTGWNLDKKSLPLDTQPGGGPIRWLTHEVNGLRSNAVPYAVDTLSEQREKEPNDDIEHAAEIKMNAIVNGNIERPGDTDVFAIQCVANKDIVAEVYARRLYSPLDSGLRITGAEGKELAANDDFDDMEAGLLAHQADSYVCFTPPADGTYYVHLCDMQEHGGEAYSYRLRLSAPRPDFALRVTPSTLNILPGGIVPVTVHVLRKDGFKGKIKLDLPDAPEGFKLDGGTVAEDLDKTTVTITAPREGGAERFALNIQGTATIGGKERSHTAVPAEDRMQAFIYWHLTPSRELTVTMLDKKPLPKVTLTQKGALKIPLGGAAQAGVTTWKSPLLSQIKLQLLNPPAGISLGAVEVLEKGLNFPVHADAAVAKTGTKGNLIVEVYLEKPAQGAAKKAQKRYVGVLPAMPFEIVPAGEQ